MHGAVLHLGGICEDALWLECLPVIAIARAIAARVPLDRRRRLSNTR